LRYHCYLQYINYKNYNYSYNVVFK